MAETTTKKKKTAFILAGGASRGAYQAGCLKRLEEEGVKPDLIIGSSIGVCNSLVYASGGAEALWAFWSRAVTLPQVFDISLRKNLLFGNSLFSMGRLQKFVESEVDFDACFESETELTYIVANLSAGHEELRGNRTEADVERFKTVTRIGFLWNVPFEYAEEWGATDVYILSVVPSRLQRADSLRFVHQVALRMYDVFWRTFGNSSYLEKTLEDGTYHGINVTVLEPEPEPGMFDPLGMLNAYPGKSRKLLWQGYRDTERVLHHGKPASGRVKGKVPDKQPG
jgi:hypothetical protein